MEQTGQKGAVMRYWTSKDRRRRAKKPPHRFDTRGPMRHARRVSDRKDWNRLADFVLQERKAHSLTQRDLAQLMDVDVRSVRRIEAGQSVSKTTLAAVDAAFDLPRGTARQALHGTPASEETSRETERRGRAAVDRLLAMSHEELAQEAALYDEVEPGFGDDWLRRALEVRRRVTRQRTANATPEEPPQ